MNPPPPPQLPPPPPPPRPTPNQLNTTFSSLNNLITLSNQILQTTPQPQTLNTNLIHCPFNPNHLIPPPSLFLHHLRCPSSPRTLPDLDHLLNSLSYPKTLQNPNSIHLSSYFHFPSNFFYNDCPGAVDFSESTAVAKTATFSLPDFLSLECSNSTVCSPTPNPTSILPSEYYYISRELDSWNQFPNYYSKPIIRAILGIGIAKENEMADWLISNSPRYGVVIDTPMQKHIFLLFSLCFKSILREASVSLDCPVLNKALAWFESQVSILYGVNGKLFVLNFVKKCILVGASALFLLPLGKEVVDSAASTSKQENNIDCIRERKILMPQVVAAVAALHERLLLERKIKGFWFSHPSNNYQLVAEHHYLSDKANEERNKRNDYRPLIDYDWVHRHLSSHQNQETHREKTREEILAEERDYKRRRMSYRGKKRNQSTLQVMRDLIAEYMEEIKHAGGVTNPVSVSEDSRMPPPPPRLPSSHNIPMEANTSRTVSQDSPAVTISNQGYHEQQSNTNYFDKSKAVHDVTARDYEQQKQGQYRNHHNEGYQRTADQGTHRSRASTSPERQRSHSRSHEHIIHKKQDYSNRKTYNNSSRTKDRWQNDTHKNHISDSFSRNVFSERYDPSEPHDVGELDISSDDKYIKQDKFYQKERN